MFIRKYDEDEDRPTCIEIIIPTIISITAIYIYTIVINYDGNTKFLMDF